MKRMKDCSCCIEYFLKSKKWWWYYFHVWIHISGQIGCQYSSPGRILPGGLIIKWPDEITLPPPHTKPLKYKGLVLWSTKIGTVKTSPRASPSSVTQKLQSAAAELADASCPLADSSVWPHCWCRQTRGKGWLTWQLNFLTLRLNFLTLPFCIGFASMVLHIHRVPSWCELPKVCKLHLSFCSALCHRHRQSWVQISRSLLGAQHLF